MDNDGEVLYMPICDDKSLIPHVGKCFATIDLAINFYTEYARIVGFDVRKQGGRKYTPRQIGVRREEAIYLHRYMVCSREGTKNNASDVADNNYNNDESKHRHTSNRCFCPAEVVFKYVADIGYIVSKFVEEHNHDLVQDKCMVFLKGNRKMDHLHQTFITDCAGANIGPSYAHKLLCEFMGGQEFVGCTVMEARNFTRDLKAYVEGADAQMLLNQMRRKKELCDSFTFDYEVDAEDKLKRLFWCDPICRRNYHMFGDVVSFDTTYSTNKYCMIFAPFTGKDNHGTPITFASGLLSKEDSDSFMWLFDKFIRCMGMQPKMIITDQDLGMRSAIEKVLPNTRHRWCMWHIMLKVADKVPRELHSNDDFKNS